jgi:hypothetical protein
MIHDIHIKSSGMWPLMMPAAQSSATSIGHLLVLGQQNIQPQG